jgi:hypothetical protein
MTDLLMKRSAVISDCDLYRHELRRIWDDRLPLLVVCMLNPSKADADIDDPTILTLIHFAKRWGYGGLLVVNLADFRASKPDDMFAASSPTSKVNARYHYLALTYAKENGKEVLVAWGNDGPVFGTDGLFVETAKSLGVRTICLGITLSGAPKHPMARGKHRIPRDQKPLPWAMPQRKGKS